VLREVKATPELYKDILSLDRRMWFGHIEVDDDVNHPGMVYLTMCHTLLGDYLDEAELGTALFGVLNAADGMDEDMQKKFGGKRWAAAAPAASRWVAWPTWAISRRWRPLAPRLRPVPSPPRRRRTSWPNWTPSSDSAP